MSKKILAIAIVLLMTLGVLGVIHPAAAQTPGGVSVFLRPGVEDPYHPGWSQTLGTLRDHTEEVTSHWQDYAILASTDTSASIGDLQFDITFGADFTGAIRIWVPPQFTFMKPDGTEATTANERAYNVWTDITNDYGYIGVSKRYFLDSRAPDWYRITVGLYYTSPGLESDVLYAGLTIPAGTHHIHLFNLKAPSVAGVYYFRVALLSPYPTYLAFDPNDWPIIIVKNEVNSGYVIGTVGPCGDLPCTVAVPGLYGMVQADGTTPTGRSVSAAYYFGPEDDPTSTGVYNFYLFGVAEGTYTLSASAGGHPKATGERFDVTPGQSVHLKTIWLGGGSGLTVTVWSKHGRGELPWGSLYQPPFGNNNPYAPTDLGRPRPIMIDIYDSAGNWVTGTYLQTSLTDPTATSFTMSFGAETNWSGMAPAWGSQPIDGFGAGTYSVQAHVTGYVMTDDDAWQRTFSTAGGGGADIKVQMDLRRSNWFAVQLHFGTSDLPTVPTSLLLTAVDSSGNEVGGTSLLVAGTQVSYGGSNPGDLLFYDSPTTLGTYGPQTNPLTGAHYNIMTDPIILEGWSYKYNLCGCSADAVDSFREYGLMPGTYDIALYMADMGDPSGAIYGTGPQAAIQGNGWYTIHEGDPHSGTIALCNSPSALSFRVRENWLTLAIRSVDWETPSHIRAWTFPGAEIWTDIMDSSGSTVETIDPGLYGLVQDDGTIGSPYAVTPDVNLNPACTISTATADLTACLSIKYTGMDYYWYEQGPMAGLDYNYYNYPTHLAPGQYSYALHTLGYVTRRSFPNSMTLGGGADIQSDLIQGGQIRVYMDWKREATDTPFNGFVRVEVFNDKGELVGANIYGQADVNPLAPGSYESYDPTVDQKLVWTNQGPAEGAGNDQNPEYGYGQRAAFSHYFYGKPAATFTGPNSIGFGWYGMVPSDATRLCIGEAPCAAAGATHAADVFGFYWYFGDKASRNDGLWANGPDTTDGVLQADTGLRGTSSDAGVDGGGLYTVKVWAFDPTSMDSYQMASDVTNVELPWGGATNVYVELDTMGRITGTVSWTDMYGDVRAMPWLLISATGSEGTSFGSSLPATLAVGSALMADPTYGASYMVWVPSGTYDVSGTASAAPQVFEVPMMSGISVSPGFTSSADIGIKTTGTPVPEFGMAPLVALSALAASLYVLKRRRK
jgi:hypothetical protein